MTSEKINIAIAKTCGYRNGELKPFWLATPVGQPFKACGVNDLPNYHGDLNAMHEAYLSLDYYKRTQFTVELANGVTRRGVTETGQFHQEYVNATAAQRAEAFLRTLNLWES